MERKSDRADGSRRMHAWMDGWMENERGHTKGQSVITQNALPSEGESVEGEGVGVVGHHHSQGLPLVGQLQSLGDGVVKGDGLVERHVCPAVVVSLVNAPAWPQRWAEVTWGGLLRPLLQQTSHVSAVGVGIYSSKPSFSAPNVNKWSGLERRSLIGRVPGRRVNDPSPAGGYSSARFSAPDPGE